MPHEDSFLEPHNAPVAPMTPCESAGEADVRCAPDAAGCGVASGREALGRGGAVSCDASDKHATEPADCDGAQRCATPACSPEALRFVSAQAQDADPDHHSTRERVALGVFAVLLLVGLFALTSYISAGHGLNVAATNIDDIAGDMEGYDVVLFAGTVEPVEEEEAETAESDAAVEAGDEAPLGESLFDEPLLPHIVADDTYTVEEARDLYVGKKASVIELNVEDPLQYANGRITMKAGHTYGIVSVPENLVGQLSIPKKTTTKTTTVTTEGEEPGIFGASSENATTTTSVKNAYNSVSELFAATEGQRAASSKLTDHMESVLARFEKAGVDTVIVLTPDPTPFREFSGIDVVLTLKEKDRFTRPETIDGTLYVDAPEEGTVGALLIAPGNVVSSKVLSAS